MSIKVLVFESDPVFAGELRSELGKLGCNTVVVDDGNLGLQQAAAERPDLILLSIELPRMNGFSVCNKLKKDGALKDVPLIIMSSESSDETFEQHKKLRTRAEDYVHKPIAFGELLRHIQAFIQLGSAASEGDAVIVIDDEIEIGTTDYLAEDDAGTQTAVRAPSGAPAAHATSHATMEAHVDDDVDAFADAAFGRLTGGDPPGITAEARPIHNGANEPATPPSSARKASVAPARTASARPPASRPPPNARPASMRPTPGVDAVEFEKVRHELDAVRARAADTETALRDARDEADKLRLEAGEAERLRREMEELKTKLAAGPKAGGISSREFLDLREALNKKDKEILSLREQASKKDREIVEAQDRMLVLERSKADLEDKLLSIERELAEARDKNDALTSDLDIAKRAADDLKIRFERVRLEGEAKDRQLAELRAATVEEAEEFEEKLAAMRAEFDQQLANERADQARRLDQAEDRRRSDIDQAARDREAALAESRELADKVRHEALAIQAAQLAQEHEAKATAAVRAHQQELERLRAAADHAAREAQAAHDAALENARREGREATAAARADAEEQTEVALEGLRVEHGEKVKAIENDRDSRIAALEAKVARELGEANERNAKADMDLSATRGELSDLRQAKAAADAEAAAKIGELEQSLASTTSARDRLSAELSTTAARLSSLEVEDESVRQELAETKQRLAAESSRAERAHAKWQSDRQSLERAKDALAVALSQIEEAEERPIA
jgi:CheY-like chemotaxis protein